MIHRALFGSIERFFGVLTEHYAGAFPAWLAPVQVVGVPVAEEFADYLGEFIDELRSRASELNSTIRMTGCRKRFGPTQNQKSRLFLLPVRTTAPRVRSASDSVTAPRRMVCRSRKAHALIREAIEQKSHA
jgi:threonyl-tRNA synthetase